MVVNHYVLRIRKFDIALKLFLWKGSRSIFLLIGIYISIEIGLHA